MTTEAIQNTHQTPKFDGIWEDISNNFRIPNNTNLSISVKNNENIRNHQLKLEKLLSNFLQMSISSINAQLSDRQYILRKERILESLAAGRINHKILSGIRLIRSGEALRENVMEFLAKTRMRRIFDKKTRLVAPKRGYKLFQDDIDQDIFTFLAITSVFDALFSFFRWQSLEPAM